MAYLEVETPEGSRRVALDRDRLSIGRLSYNTVVLSSPQISRQHAELRRVNGEWWVTDLHSTNGVQLDGRRIQEHRLASGERLFLAPGISFRFVDEADPSAAPSTWSTASSAFDSGDAWAQRPAERFVSRGPAATSSPFAPAPASAPSPMSVPPPSSFDPPSPPSAAVASAPAPDGWNGIQTMRPVGYGQPAPSGTAGGPASSGGYPAPRGPMVSGSDVLDPSYLPAHLRQSTREPGAPTQPASTLLHVCQTCGQRTAPDAVYCQSCHHSIAAECPNCRLSLLPIQDRCPRCHTPNAYSVRRGH